MEIHAFVKHDYFYNVFELFLFYIMYTVHVVTIQNIPDPFGEGWLREEPFSGYMNIFSSSLLFLLNI